MNMKGYEIEREEMLEYGKKIYNKPEKYNMVEIIEVCRTEDMMDGKEYEGIRIIHYQTKHTDLLEALKEQCSSEFDFDNIVFTDDYFPGGCLDSEIVSIKFI